MEIYNAIDAWCKAENAKKPLKQVAAVTIGLFLSLVLIASLTNNMIWFALAVVVVFLWAIYAPKGRSAKSFMAMPTLRQIRVPDDLLMHLADDPKIPGWVKGKIATALHDTKQINFEFLLSLDGDISTMKEFDKLEAGQGFKAMTAFGDSREDKEGHA